MSLNYFHCQWCCAYCTIVENLHGTSYVYLNPLLNPPPKKRGGGVCCFWEPVISLKSHDFIFGRNIKWNLNSQVQSVMCNKKDLFWLSLTLPHLSHSKKLSFKFVSERLRSEPAKENVSFLQTCKHVPAAWCLSLSIFHYFLSNLLHLITVVSVSENYSGSYKFESDNSAG